MSRSLALSAAVALTTLAASLPAAAQSGWPAPQQQQQPSSGWPAAPQAQQQQQAPAGAWPAPNAAPSAPAGAWPAPQAGQQPQANAAPAFVPPSSGFGPSMGAPQQEPPCIKDFMKLREGADKKRVEIEQAGKKRVAPAVACRLFTDFVGEQTKLIKFVSANAAKCGMPPELLDNLNKGYAQTNQVRARVCEVAAAPPKPAGPTLNDVLSSPIPDASNTRSGRGTFDTLGGKAIR